MERGFQPKSHKDQENWEKLQDEIIRVLQNIAQEPVSYKLVRIDPPTQETTLQKD